MHVFMYACVKYTWVPAFMYAYNRCTGIHVCGVLVVLVCGVLWVCTTLVYFHCCVSCTVWFSTPSCSTVQ